MAGIASVFSSLITQIKTIGTFQFVHIWNNQLQQLIDGDTYAFPFPNAFVEVITPNEYTAIGQGYSVGDLVIRIHIGHEEYDAGNGNFEENVNVFTYRDAIIKALNNFQPTSCSSMMKVGEQQDYTHTNIYHYMVDFKTAFVDSKGSLDEQIPTTTVEPPITIEIDIDRVDSIDGQINEPSKEIVI